MTAAESTTRSVRRLGAGLLAVALGAAGALIASAPAAAATFEVTTLDDAGPGSLRQAVVDANNEMLFPGADLITFAAGLSGTIELESTLDVTSEVIIDGTGATITISRDNTAGDFDLVHVVLPTGYLPFSLIDVDIVADGDVPQQLGRGLVVEGFEGVDIGRVQLTDVVIANHKAAPGTSGGGAYVASSTYVDVLRGAIASNEADDDERGGGLRVDGGNFGSLHVTGTQVVSNTGGIGGGIAVDQVNGVFITDSFFQLNTASDPANGVGGAIDASQIAIDGVEISGSTFDLNFAEVDGGALAIVDSGPPQISRSTFSSNIADSGNGGAIYLHEIFQSSTITESTFTGNDADGFGGAVAYETIDAGDSGTVTGSTFSSNDSGDGGAAIGIAVVSGSFLLQNSTLDELTATGDPFAFAANAVDGTGLVAIENSTITGPGGVALFLLDGVATAENSIIDGGVGPALFVDVGAGSFTYSYSLLNEAPGPGFTDGGGNVISASNGLLALADNGGPTLTRLPEPGSLAIDAGDPAFVSPPATDQRGTGFARVVAGRIDMGAVEAVPTLPATGAAISWWLLIVAGAVFALGAVALVLARRARRGGATR